MKICLAFGGVTLLLGGCAHVPDTSVHYYPARTDLNMKVTRLLACSPDNQIFSSQTVTTTAVNRADMTKPIELDLGLLNSTFADTSFTAELRDDGRLKGINASETGKAGEIVKSAVSLAKLFFATGMDGPRNNFPKLCALIAGEKDKIATLEYEANLVIGEKDTSWDVPLTGASQQFLASAETAGAEVEPLKLTLRRVAVAKPGFAAHGPAPSGISFKYPARVSFTLEAHGTGLWHDDVSIAQMGIDGWLPIARAPAFGKTTTTIDLNEDGSLKKIAYGSEAGSVAALGATSGLVGLVDRKTDTERAAAAEAEMKRIKAERNLLKCRADPASC